jgi:hypothetical protein
LWGHEFRAGSPYDWALIGCQSLDEAFSPGTAKAIGLPTINQLTRQR